MALDGTYNGLKASIADFLNRIDLTAAVPDFIKLAEAQMARRFVSRQAQAMPVPRRLIKRGNLTFSLAAEYVTVPTDMLGPIDLLLTPVSGNILDIDYLDSVNLQSIKTQGFYPRYTFTQPATGSPLFYTVVGTQIQILPVADQAYTGELTYISRLAALSTATEAANWILQDYPDAYLYGALTASAPYLKDDARAQTWGTLFAAAVDDICNADPMPTDKSTLRTELALIQRFSRRGGYYSITTDNI